MTNGPSEQIGKVATSTVDALKGQPVLIFLLVFILVALGLFAWVGSNTRSHYDTLYQALLDNQGKLMAMCGKGG